MFSSSVAESETKLISDLCSVVPFNPRLLNKLYALSNVGLREKYLGKFINTSSIQHLAVNVWADEAQVLKTIHQMGQAYSRHLIGPQNSSIMGWLARHRCNTVVAQLMRVESWGTPIEGVTMPSMTELCSVTSWSDSVFTGRSVLLTKTSAMMSPEIFHHRQGTPYFGSETNVRSKRSALQTVEVGSLVSSIKKIMTITSWIKQDPKFERFLQILITKKTTVDLPQLGSIASIVYAGSISHRLPCQGLRRGGLHNTALNFNSNWIINSDTASDFAKSGSDYNLCFQSIFLHGLAMLQMKTLLKEPVGRVMACSFVCPDCIFALQDDNYTMQEPTYPGVHLVTKIEQLTPIERTLSSIELSPGNDPNVIESYSFAMGRRFFLLWRKQERKDLLSAVERNAIHENISAGFINLSEFKFVNVRIMLAGFLR